MTQKLAPNWLLFTEQFPQFMKTYRRLAREAWFQDEGWTAFIAHYREGIYMQVYKLHWCNHLHGGIHMELALNQQLLETKRVNLAFDAHKEGLIFDRDQLNVETTTAMKELVQDLGEPFEFREKSLSTRISATFGCSPSNFAVKAAKHFELLRPVGQIIDDALLRLFSVGPRSG